jgi:protein-disulfide isomerase
MANKRVDAGRGRKPGVVKAATKDSTTNRIFYLIIALVAIGGIGALTYASAKSKNTVQVTAVDTTLPPVQSEGYVAGNAAAPLEVIEFGDFECPQCSRFATLTEPDVRSRLVNEGRVRFRYIDFPLDMHKNTWNASRAAACADEQGRFWEMHDAIYQTQDQWSGEVTNNPDKFMKGLAKQVGLKQDQFNQCVDTKKYQAKIQAHLKIAMDRHVNATPTFFIGAKNFAGFLTYDEFKHEVDSAIAAGVKTPAAVGGDTAHGMALPKPKS